MNKKLIMTSVALLLVGAIAIAVINTRDAGRTGDAGSATGEKADPGARGGETASGASAGADSAKPGERTRKNRDAAIAELEAKYGGARTSLSRQVVANVVSLLDDAIAMGEMMTGNEGAAPWGGGRMMVQRFLRETELEFTEEQKDKTAALYTEFQERELEKAKSVVNTLKKDPLPMMELFLAGDAQSRGEMGEDEFAQVQETVGQSLAGIINPLDRNNFRGGNPLRDPEFREGFLDLLDEEQAQALEAEAIGPETPESSVPSSSITSLPTMELETLDEAVGSAKKMTAGFRSMMEGMGTLRELQPQIEGGEGDGEDE